MLHQTMDAAQLVDVLKAGLLSEGTELYRGIERRITFVIRNQRLETWHGRVVADQGGFLSRPRALPVDSKFGKREGQ